MLVETLVEPGPARPPFPHCGAAHGASGGPRATPESGVRVVRGRLAARTFVFHATIYRCLVTPPPTLAPTRTRALADTHVLHSIREAHVVAHAAQIVLAPGGAVPHRAAPLLLELAPVFTAGGA